MPYARKNDRNINNRLRTQVWINNHRCSHCGRKLLDNYIYKNCEVCSNKRKDWGWNQKLRALQKISGLIIPSCIKCPISDIRLLTINHKIGNTTKNRRDGRERGGYDFYKIIINGERSVDDLEVRCYNCNILYEFERGSRKNLSF
jgi:hypothetical protein